MLSLSGDADIIQSIRELNITPLTISYEWEPCDGMKVRELYLSEFHEYVKDEHEDLRSIIGGVVSNKGRIHINIGQKLNNLLDKVDHSLRKNEILVEIANLIDKQIHQNYKLWPSNYYAYDLMTKQQQFADKYDEKTKTIFSKRLEYTQEIINGNRDKVRQLFINIYANPVVNQNN